MVKKKGGRVLRLCVDYRRLNDVTVKDAFPLPRIEDNLERKGVRLFTILDLASGYWRVEMVKEDRKKTAFCTRYGLYEFRVMAFGLYNAPSTFERLVENVLGGLQLDYVVLYIDDVII